MAASIILNIMEQFSFSQRVVMMPTLYLCFIAKYGTTQFIL